MEIAIRSLAEHKMTEVSDCVTLLKDSLAGLAYLHQTNIIHRDIKPANILLTREDPVQWKLSDFGMSKMAEVTTTFCGSPMYLAPEIGELEYGAYTTAVDIWALGIVGLEYTCGFGRGNSKLLRDMTKRKPWNQAVIQQVPRSPLAQYLELMLELVPTKRPAACKLVDMLGSWAGQSQGSSANAVQSDKNHGADSSRIPYLRATIA